MYRFSDIFSFLYWPEVIFDLHIKWYGFWNFLYPNSLIWVPSTSEFLRFRVLSTSVWVQQFRICVPSVRVQVQVVSIRVLFIQGFAYNFSQMAFVCSKWCNNWMCWHCSDLATVCQIQNISFRYSICEVYSNVTFGVIVFSRYLDFGLCCLKQPLTSRRGSRVIVLRWIYVQDVKVWHTYVYHTTSRLHRLK